MGNAPSQRRGARFNKLYDCLHSMYLHSLTLCQYTFNIFSLDMSILFSNFAVEIKITFSPPETRIIGKHMRIDLNPLSTSALGNASNGINEVIDELKEVLGDERFKNEFYIQLLTLSNIFGSEWLRRQREAEGL